MYGTTVWGGAGYNGSYGGQGDGTIFSLPTSGGTSTTLVSFNGSDGRIPGGNLTLSGTTLYGMTNGGGAYGSGNVFSVGTDGTGFCNLFSFNGSNGNGPNGSLTLSGSTLFGMTYGGAQTFYPDYYGNIFSISTNGTGFQNLVYFTGPGGTYPGKWPWGNNLILSGSILYGTTPYGASSGCGSVFSLGTNGSGFQNVLSFTGSGGAFPGGVVFSSLVLIGTNLYGTTWNEGGANNCGSIFCIGTNGSGFQSLLAFTGTGGAYPGAGPRDLSVASASAINLGSLGNATVISGGSAVLGATLTNSATSSTLYGMTQSGGRSDDGTIYSLTVPGATT